MRYVARWLVRLGVVGVTATGTGCEGGEPRGEVEAGVGYHRQVAPLLAKHCVSCHREGEIAPFALDTYERARPLAAAMAAAVRARAMPPSPVDVSGACNSFRAARWLSDEEIATFAAWSEAGAPEGLPAPPAEVTPAPSLTGEILPVVMPETYIPDAALEDDYRCFTIETGRTEEELSVTGFDVHPGEARTVHHVIVYHPTSDEAADEARSRDAQQPGAGYTCFGTAGVLANVVAAWAPGGGATFYPPGTGVKIRPHRPLIVQVHYNNLIVQGAPDRTGVELQLGDASVVVGRFMPLVDLSLRLPPHQESAEAGVDASLGKLTAPVRVMGVFPHMHTLGRTLRIEALRDDGARQCLVDVPRWNFHWQSLYFYEQPVTIAPTDLLSLRCSFDTRSRDQETRWGEGTMDEMCLAGLFVLP